MKKQTTPTKIKGHEVKALKSNPEYIVESEKLCPVTSSMQCNGLSVSIFCMAIGFLCAFLVRWRRASRLARTRAFHTFRHYGAGHRLTAASANDFDRVSS